ncbi:MAG: type I-D CRISPR-associated protein Cas5/Csc1 [Candidatus Viridilinea halotolerans]|uniref:Type I-D CRISPR-associated protein Cas5/Csc1 n=1 Tax=Candidatus Viridilinea halotolerans TaxID=2491704 RepID=A0A426TU36_9CHLR|nr:MAG: type I-D CRISPR-associated protein Cas5/Csc1 [Candidatus Viridilinea halotolerans]
MHIYTCSLTLQESLFFATRELGRLYETGRYLHNYALTYAFGFVAAPYFHPVQVPRYAEELATLNERQIYVTPALPVMVDFQLSTIKYGEEVTHSEMLPGRLNTPSFGRIKELAPESTFRCYVLSSAPLRLPRWIRLGKWHSKTLVEAHEVEFVEERQGNYQAPCPLNPLDVQAGTLRAFDIISMPPASLVANGRCAGPHYALAGGQGLPCGMAYRFAA